MWDAGRFARCLVKLEVAKTGSAQQSIEKNKLVVWVSKHGLEPSTHYSETESHLHVLQIG